MNDEPKIIGRWNYGDGDEVDDRASTQYRTSVTCHGSWLGNATATLFKSVDCGDRGGVVLRLTIEGGDSNMIPHTINIPGGVEIHLCGENEAAMFLRAIQKIIDDE